MEYDSKENVWRAAGSLPQTLGTIMCCAAWRDMIFVSGSAKDTEGDAVFYMLKPPPPIECEAVTQDQILGEWTAFPIQRPQLPSGVYKSFSVSAVTIEI